MHLSYYDRIATSWDKATGSDGGAFNRLVLNERVLALIGDVSEQRILKLGASNGYFARLLWRRRSGKEPARLTITDSSSRLLQIARKRYVVPCAQYATLDLRTHFPFESARVDLVVAVMVFSELPARTFRNALCEAARVLAYGGRVVGAVLHPRFVAGLSRRGELKRGKPATMPGADEQQPGTTQPRDQTPHARGDPVSQRSLPAPPGHRGADGDRRRVAVRKTLPLPSHAHIRPLTQTTFTERGLHYQRLLLRTIRRVRAKRTGKSPYSIWEISSQQLSAAVWQTDTVCRVEIELFSTRVGRGRSQMRETVQAQRPLARVQWHACSRSQEMCHNKQLNLP